jgi:hypothetical protein
MVQAFPETEFVGFLDHFAAIVTRWQGTTEASVSDRVRFELWRTEEPPGMDHDFVTFFDRLHDMGELGGTASRARQLLFSSGAWMISWGCSATTGWRKA